MLFRVSFWNDRADTEVFGKTIEAENECEAEGIFFDELEEENDYKREKYNPEKIFETTDIDNNSKLKNQELTEIPKDSFFTKLKKIFMRFFKKNH